MCVFAHYEGNKVSNNVSNYGERRESLDSGKVQVLKKVAKWANAVGED